MSRPYDSQVPELARALAQWLLANDRWEKYPGQVGIDACSHPDRASKLVPMIKLMDIEVSPVYPPRTDRATEPYKPQRKTAFLLRCKGPVDTHLEPRKSEAFPAEIVPLHQDEGSTPTLNGKAMEVGERITLETMAHLVVHEEQWLFFCAIFENQ